MRRCLLALLFPVLLASTALAQVEVRVPDLNARLGEFVIVPIRVSQGEGVAALQFAVEFDPQVLSLEGTPLKGDLLDDHSLGSGFSNGRLDVVVFSGSLSTLRSGNGSIAQVAFRVLADGAFQVSLADVQASDTAGSPLPVTALPGTITVSTQSNRPAPGQNQLVFPQVANGEFTGGSFFVTLIFVNRTEAPSFGEVFFFRSNGAPFPLTLTDGRAGSAFDFEVPAGGTVLFQTNGGGDLAAGYALTNATAPLGGVLLFTAVNSSQQVLTEAGVQQQSRAESRFSVPVLFEAETVNTGIALANPSSQAVELTLTLKVPDGAPLATSMLTLNPGEHSARFANEFFELLNMGPAFEGSIEVVAPIPVFAVALEQKGILLTTFPVVEK